MIKRSIREFFKTTAIRRKSNGQLSQKDSQIALDRHDLNLVGSLIEALPDAAVILASGRIIACNKKAENFVDLSQSSMLEKPISALITLSPTTTKIHDSLDSILRKTEGGDKVTVSARLKTRHTAPIRATFSGFADATRALVSVILQPQSEQLDLDEALISSENKYRTIIDKAAETIVVVQDGLIKFTNKTAERLLGYSCKEIEGTSIFDYVHDDDKARIAENYQKRIQHKPVENSYNFRVVARDGKIKWVRINAAYFEWQMRPATLNLLTDITSQVAAETALQESESLFRVIADNLPHAFIALINRQFRIIYLSGQESKKRRIQQESIGKHFKELFDDGEEQTVQKLTQALQETFAGKEQILNAETLHHSFRFKSVPLRNVNGKIDQVLVVVEDITEQKRADQQLQESEDRFRITFHNASDAIYLLELTEKGTIIREVNRTAAQSHGYTPEELIGQPSNMLVTKQRHDNVPHIVEKILNGESVHYEGLDVRKDGSTFPVEISASQVTIGNKQYILSIERDISERKKVEKQIEQYQAHLEDLVKLRTKELEQKADKMRLAQKAMRYLVEDANEAREQLEASNQRLLESNKQLEAFAYSVSHDLRAPLRAISGFSNKLDRLYHEKLDDEGRRIIGIINDNTNKMAQLIDDLLTFSRVSRTDLNTQDVDLTEMVKEISQELKILRPMQKIEFTISPLQKAKADPRLLRQALFNLIENAVKYSSRKKVSKIHIGMANKNGKSCYFIKDNGVGFDLKYADKLFKVFHRLHKENEFSGTGVGLTIAQLIINRHNGQIWPEAEPDKGATFFFTLPEAIDEKA